MLQMGKNVMKTAQSLKLIEILLISQKHIKETSQIKMMEARQALMKMNRFHCKINILMA